MVRLKCVFVLLALCCLTQGFQTFLKYKKSLERTQKRGDNLPPPCPLPVRDPPLDPDNLPSSVQETLNLVNKTVQSILLNNNITAATFVTMVSGENVIFSQGYNSISETDKTTPTETTLFRVGSVSKVFTVLELLHQYEKGNVELDVDITTYVPDFEVTKPSKDPDAKVTFNAMAAQISGLPREAPCFYYHCHLNNSQMFDRYQGTPLLWLPERLPSYSNMGFGMIGNTLGAIYPLNQTQIIDNCLKHAGPETCHFISGVHQDILGPLGMTSTGYIYEVDVQGEVVQGYNGATPIADKYAFGSVGWASPALGLFSCHRDLAKMMSYVLTYLDKEAPDSLPLSSSSLREWMAPHFINNDRATGFGRPWEIYYVESTSMPGVGFWVNTKDGDIAGYEANLVFVQELNLGIMVTVAAEPPVSIAPSMAAFATAKMVDTLASYYYSLPQTPPLPSNYSLYTGKYVANVLDLSQEDHLMFEMLNGEKITAQNLPTLIISYENPHSLHFTYSTGDTVLDMSIIRSEVIVGEKDYWQLLIPSVTQEANTYPFYLSSCTTFTEGYEGVHVEFELEEDDGKPQVISLAIPTEFYGVSFVKT